MSQFVHGMVGGQSKNLVEAVELPASFQINQRLW